MKYKKITFTEKELEIIKSNEKQAEVGGRSKIRNEEDRKKFMDTDKLAGQLGEAALSKFLTGDIELYKKTRDYRNAHKKEGDDGTDLIGYRVDVKTSMARMRKGYLYHLYVRDKEYHSDVMYYLALIPKNSFDVYLIGKIMGNELPNSENGRRAIRMDKLYPIT